MDIYILREGKEIGPFPETKVQMLLGQGSVAPADLSWCSGMSKWLPLSDAFPALAPPAEEGAPAAAAPEPIAAEDAEPATPKQRALLHFLGVRLDPALTKSAAALLVSNATENAAYTVRLAQWQHERFKLHPEIFADELQAKRENRVNHYHELTQTMGAAYFSKVTKAHAEVLIRYLDVSFPNWDAREATAAQDYFFPAVAEKFPQLVQAAWQGRLKYASGPRVAPEIITAPAPAPFEERTSGRSHFAAAARGLFFGVLILGVAWFAHRVLQGGKSTPAPEPAATAIAATPATDVAPPAAPTPAPPIPLEPEPPSALKPQEPEKPAEPAMAATPPPAEPAPTPPATPEPAAAPAAPAPPSGPPALYTQMRLKRAFEATSTYGKVVIPAGSVVRFLALEGDKVRVQYLKDTLLIPAAWTNLSELPPAPAAPGLDPSLLPPPLTAPPDPLAPPPAAKDSLFGEPKPTPGT